MQGQVREFALALEKPLATAAGEIDRREGWLVRIAGDEAVGVGEATPLPGWTESLDDCETALERAVDRLETDGRAAALASLDETPAARHGLDGAIADLEARRAGVPLYRYLREKANLGGGTQSDGETTLDRPTTHTRATTVDRVPVNATIGDGDVHDTVGAVRTAIQAGFSTLKIKVANRSVAGDVARLEAVREAVGPSIALRADANGAWSPAEAREGLSAFESIGVEYVEQPLPAEDLGGHVALAGGTVGIAFDETIAVLGVDAVLEHGAGNVAGAEVGDVVILKPMVLGGPTRTVEIASRARAAGMEPVVTTTVDGVVARTGAVHCTAAIPDPSPAGLATGDRLAADLASDPVVIRDGSAVVPCGKGLGVAGVWDD
jgi:o-succinylbenzoate synthase